MEADGGRYELGLVIGLIGWPVGVVGMLCTALAPDCANGSRAFAGFSRDAPER